MRPSSVREFCQGTAAIAPAAVAVIPFALLLGALATQKGLSVTEVALMSALVFAGSAQFVAVDIWREPAPWLLIGVSTLTINLRHVMMGASLSRHLTGFPRWQRYVSAFFMADEIWALAERQALQGPLTPAFYAGLAGTLYVNFLFWTVMGALAGALLSNPAAWAFDFAFTAIFIGLIAGFWRGRPTVAVIAASAVTAVATSRWLGGVWHVIAGSVAGGAAAVLTAGVRARSRDRAD